VRIGGGVGLAARGAQDARKMAKRRKDTKNFVPDIAISFLSDPCNDGFIQGKVLSLVLKSCTRTGTKNCTNSE
jgi:hypothetical protein